MKKLLFLIAAVMMTCFSITTSLTTHAAESFESAFITRDYYAGSSLTNSTVRKLVNSARLDNYGNESGTATMSNSDYSIYESMCKNYGFQLYSTELADLAEGNVYFDAMPLRPQTIDNFVLIHEDALEHEIDDLHSVWAGNIQFGYFFSKERIQQYVCYGQDIFSYVDEEEGSVVYNDEGLSYEYRSYYDDLRLKNTFKINSGASSFIIENAFMVNSDVSGLLKITLNYYTDDGVLFACEASDLSEITYTFKKEMNEQLVCYIPVNANNPILFGAQHGGNAISINNIEFFSMGEGTDEEINPFGYSSGVLDDDSILDELYNIIYNNGLEQGTLFGESLHASDYQDGYNDGLSTGEELHASDYQNGYNEGFAAGEELHASDYQNGYDAGYSSGLLDGEALHTNDYQDGYNDGFADGEELHAIDYQNGYKKGYNDGYNAAKLDSDVPNINALNIVVGNSKELSIDEIKALFSYYDNDNNNDELVFEITTNEYSKNYKLPGNYKIVGTIMDPSGNRSAATAIITVYDEVLPVIKSKTTEATYNKSLTFDEIQALFTYSDDVTLTEDLIFEIITDNYSANYNKLGQYEVTIKVTDATGNYATATTTIKVIDNIAPILTAPGKITTALENPISISAIKNRISVFDTYDGNISFEINDIDNYSNPSVGTYKLEVTATDASNNQVTYTLEIEVVEALSTDLTVSDIKICIEKDDSLSMDQIKKYAAKALNIQTSDIQLISGEYDTVASGNYELSILLNDGSLATLTVHVSSDNTSNYIWLYVIIGVALIAFVATSIIVTIKKKQ